MWSVGGAVWSEALQEAKLLEGFSGGGLVQVLRGTSAGLHLAGAESLVRVTIQVEQAFWLLGLVGRSDRGVLVDPGRREAPDEGFLDPSSEPNTRAALILRSGRSPRLEGRGRHHRGTETSWFETALRASSP